MNAVPILLLYFCLGEELDSWLALLCDSELTCFVCAGADFCRRGMHGTNAVRHLCSTQQLGRVGDVLVAVHRARFYSAGWKQIHH
jgi:hypothetical protein